MDFGVTRTPHHPFHWLVAHPRWSASPSNTSSIAIPNQHKLAYSQRYAYQTCNRQSSRSYRLAFPPNHNDPLFREPSRDQLATHIAPASTCSVANQNQLRHQGYAPHRQLIDRASCSELYRALVPPNVVSRIAYGLNS